MRIILVAILILVVGLVTFWWQAHASSKSSFVTAAIKPHAVASAASLQGFQRFQKLKKRIWP
jgi:hypothetical protein